MAEFDWTDPTAAFDLEQDALQRRLAMAQALRMQPRREFKTGAQALSGNIAGAVRSLSSGIRERQALEGLDDLAQRRATTVSPQTRLEAALKQAQLDKATADRARLAAPAGQQLLGLLRRTGVQPRDGMTTGEAEALLDPAKGVAQLEQDSWSAVADPVTGGILMYNRKTGETRPMGPGGGAPGAGAAYPPLPGKPTERQRNSVTASRGALGKLDRAIQLLEANPGAYGGAGNFAAGAAEKLPVVGPIVQSVGERRYSPGELQAKNAITDVVSSIINERAGSSVTESEALRQKFLPKDTDGLQQALQKLRDLRETEMLNYKAASGQEVTPTPSDPKEDAKQRAEKYIQEAGRGR